MGSSSRLQRAAVGLASLATLTALAACVPIVLWRLAGWPLPTLLPSLHDVANALSHSDISDSTLLKAIALVGWIAWLQVATSIVVEVVAWVRGRPAPRIRFAGAAQPAVRRLVASAALLLSSAHVAYAVPSALPAQNGSVVQTMNARPMALVTSDARTEARQHDTRRADPAPAMTRTYTVARYDTLWGLAEKHLGDPLRWRELFELNRGVHQPDGRSLEQPNLIIAGWILTLPPDAIGLSPAPTPSVPLPTQQPAQHKPVAAAVCAPPSTPHPATTPTPVHTPSTVPTTKKAPPTIENRPPAIPADRRLDPVLLIGGGLAAACLVALLDRLRRVQRRRRRPNGQVRAPRPEIEQVERQLRRAADLDEAELLDLVLRAFAGATGARDAPPAILAVRIHEGTVELLADRPLTRPPKGFVIADDARSWSTDAGLEAEDLRALAAGSAAPLPALVSLGDLDGGRLLIDIETAGTLTVDGDADHATALVRRITVELATSTWADHVDILAVGMADLDIVGAQRVRHFDELHAAIEELDAASRAISEALDSAECKRTLAARLSEHHDDGWIPTILVCTQLIDDDDLARLLKITTGGGRGVGAVVRSTTHGEWHANLEHADLALAPLGFHLAPALLDQPTARLLDELLTDAAVGEPDDLLDSQPSEEPIEAPSIDEPYADPPFEVEVRVLGPVEIVGSTRTIERRRGVELATYLALHPQGASDDRLKTVLWADNAPTTATFNTTVTATRSALGLASDGTHHLPHRGATGGVYRFGASVTSDVARFEARVTHARMSTSSVAIDTLRSALELVRGTPFESTRGYEWAFSEGLIANFEATVADAAHRLAQLYLDAGDSHSAIWAATQGLVAAPGDEILYRDRMLACDLAGNPAGVETVMDELCEVVEALEPYDQLHPETLALYERISHRKRTRAVESR